MFLDDFSFNKLIHPYNSEQFFEEYFEKKPLLIKRSDPDYYAGLLSPADLDRIFFYWPNSLSTVSANINNGSRTSMGAEARQRNLQAVLKGMDEGQSIILDALDNRHPPLTHLCALLEDEHYWAYQTNIYITPPKSQGFKTHADDHNVFILQTTGIKDWRVNLAATPYELRSEEKGGQKIDADNHLSLKLEPGDLLYIPKEFAHDATSDQVSSVHITLGTHPPTWYDALSFLLRHGLKVLPGLEKSISTQCLRQNPDLLIDELKLRLGDLSGIDLTSVVEKLIDQRKNNFRGLFFGALEQRLSVVPIGANDRFVNNHLLMVRREVSEQNYLVHTPHKLVELPVLFAEQIEFCLAGKAFACNQIPGMSAEEQEILLRRLMTEGLVIKLDQAKL